MMASFNIESLFTDIPLQETTDLCVENLFKDRTHVDNLSKDSFRELLTRIIPESLTLFKACVQYFLFFHQMIALQKLGKLLFISSKKLFLVSRYSNFCISILPSFSTSQSLLNLKVYDVINCLHKNLLTHFV